MAFTTNNLERLRSLTCLEQGLGWLGTFEFGWELIKIKFIIAFKEAIDL